MIGRFSANPPMACTVELDENGAFSISSSSPGAEVDAAYERQQRINDRLGGRIFAAYAIKGDETAPKLLEEILHTGFDVLLVDFDSWEQLKLLENDVEQYGLWRSDFAAPGEGTLLATPSGFMRVPNLATFEAALPLVETVEIVA